MKNTTLFFKPIPKERLVKKVWKTVVGVGLGLAGYVLLSKSLGPTFLGGSMIGLGGFMVAGDLVYGLLPMAKDMVSFVAWAIKKVKGAIRNGDK